MREPADFEGFEFEERGRFRKEMRDKRDRDRETVRAFKALVV